MSWDDYFYPHTVTVKDRARRGGLGLQYGEPRELAAEVKDEQRMVRNTDGAEVVSSSQVTVPLDSAVAPGALVTVWAGTSAEREAVVLTVGRAENGDTPLDSYLLLSLE